MGVFCLGGVLSEGCGAHDRTVNDLSPPEQNETQMVVKIILCPNFVCGRQNVCENRFMCVNVVTPFNPKLVCVLSSYFFKQHFFSWLSLFQ